jgi:hypothetical protein
VGQKVQYMVLSLAQKPAAESAVRVPKVTNGSLLGEGGIRTADLVTGFWASDSIHSSHIQFDTFSVTIIPWCVSVGWAGGHPFFLLLWYQIDR